MTFKGSLASIEEAVVIAVAYFQNYLRLEPCYLCVTQRVFIIAVGITCALAALHNPQRIGQRIYAVLMVLLAITGAFFSGKQLWLQSLPEDRIPTCGPPVDYLFDAFPVSEVIAMLLRGDGNCAKIQWELLSISMPGWVLLAFIALTLIGAFQFLRRP